MNFEYLNKNFFIRGSNQGTIKLGPTVIADGFIESSEEREEHHFISHAHTDHFRKSRIRKTWDLEKPIIATAPTLKLLEAYDINTSFNHQLVKTQNHGEIITYDSGTRVRLLENNHILGSVQIEVEYEGQRFGYSGDFGENIEEYIDVDYLIMDATYAGHSVEKSWTRDDCLEELTERIHDASQSGPVNICGTSGLLNEIAGFLGENGFWDDYKNVLGNKRVKHWCDVYSEYGYKQPTIITDDYEIGVYNEILSSKKYIQLVNRRNDFKRSVPDGTTFWIENRNINSEEPITQNNIHDRWYNVRLTSHAFADDIFSYVRNVNPKYIITDASRSETTAFELEKKLKQNFADIKIISSNLIDV